MDKPTESFDASLKIGNIELMLDDVTEVNDIAQANGLPFPTMIELNSDQLWKCNLLVNSNIMNEVLIK